jgi:hypothetical protein
MTERDPLGNNIAEVGETTYPDAIKEKDWWVTWILDEVGRKRPVAPWQTGHGFPAKWNQQLPEHKQPQTDFKTATEYVKFTPREQGISLPDDAQSDTLSLGIILPYDRPALEDCISLIDWDDVRNPKTGEIHPTAAEFINKYGGYVEVSTSGEGLHQFVWGGLRKRGKFIAPIDQEPFIGEDVPQVEIYDGGRHVAMTGRHVIGTDAYIKDGQQYIDELVTAYAHAEQDAGHRTYDPENGTYDSSTATASSSETDFEGDVPDPETGEYSGPPLIALQYRKPEDYSLAYHAVIETFYRGGGNADGYAHIQNWRLEGFAAALGHQDGLDKREIIADLGGDYLDETDIDCGCRHETPHRIEYGYERAATDRLAAPSHSTLVDYGILPPEAIDDSPSLDVVSEDAAQQESTTDGGVDTESDTKTDTERDTDVIAVDPEQPPASGGVPEPETGSEPDPEPEPDSDEQFKQKVTAAIAEFDNDKIKRATARDRIAKAFTNCYDFVFPEEQVHGWRTTLYSYHPPSGVYEPRGKRFIQKKLELVAGTL